MKKKILMIISLFILSLNFFACGKHDIKSEAEYVPKFDVTTGEIVAFLNEEIDILQYVETNNNTNETLTINCSNLNVAINKNIVKFSEIGKFTLELKLNYSNNKSIVKYINVNVKTKDVVATGINVEKENIVLNFDETIKNKCTVLPNNYTSDVLVEYSAEGVVLYDYSTGVVSPVKSGKTDVILKVCNNGTVETETRFKVEVTNYVYAEKIAINNISENETLELFCNDTLNLSYDVVPANCNQEVELSSSNNLIEIKSDKIKALNVGLTEVNVKIKSGKNSFLTYKFKIKILDKIENLNCELVDLNFNKVEFVYANSINPYILKVNRKYNVNNSNVIINDKNLSITDNNNINLIKTVIVNDYVYYYIKFINSGDTLLNLTYKNISFVNTFNVNKDYNVKVYNKINSIDLNLFNNESLEPTIDNKMYLVANNTGVDLEKYTVYKKISLQFNDGVNVGGYSISCNNENIKIVDNKIIPLLEGTTRVVVKSLDEDKYEIGFDIVVEKLYAEGIEIDNEILIYANGNEMYKSTFNLNYKIIPSYAFDDIKFKINNFGVAVLQDNVIKAVSGGVTTLVVSNKNITKKITINCVDYITEINILDNDGVENLNVSNFINSDNTVLTIRPKSKDKDVSAEYVEYKLSSSLNEFKSNFSFSSNNFYIKNCSLMKGYIDFYSKIDSSVSKRLNLEVVHNYIKTVKFNENNVEFNIINTKTYSQVAVCEPANHTETITYSSSSPSVAEVDNLGNVKLISVGETIITATSTSGKTCSYKINVVENIALKSINFNEIEVNLDLAKTKIYSQVAVCEPANHTETITYSSSAPSVAEVDNLGNVKLISVGETTITATSTSGKTCSYKINVAENIALKSINFNEIEVNLDLAKTKIYSQVAVCNPANHTETITYSSSAPSVAEVDNLGNVKLISVGETTITAISTSGKTCSYKIIISLIDRIRTLDDFRGVKPCKNYIVENDIDFAKYRTPIELNCNINFNNHAITNLEYSLFSNINANFKVENLIISCASQFMSQAIVAIKNNGIINNVKISGEVNVLLNNLSFSIFTKENAGTIKNCATENCKIYNNKNNTQNYNSKYVCSVDTNKGNFINNNINYNENKFNYVCGIAYTILSDINNYEISGNVITLNVRLNDSNNVYAFSKITTNTNNNIKELNNSVVINIVSINVSIEAYIYKLPKIVNGEKIFTDINCVEINNLTQKDMNKIIIK